MADHLSPQALHLACKEPSTASSRGKAESSPLNCTICPQLAPPIEAGSSETVTNPKVPLMRPGRQPDIHAATRTQTHRLAQAAPPSGGGDVQREAAGSRSHRRAPAGRLAPQTARGRYTDTHGRADTSWRPALHKLALTTGTLPGQANTQLPRAPLRLLTTRGRMHLFPSSVGAGGPGR